MSDNKLLAILVITVLLGLTTMGVVTKLSEKSEHDIRMEKIEEMDAYYRLLNDMELEKSIRNVKKMLKEIKGDLNK